MTMEEDKVEPPTMTPKEAIYVEVLAVISGGKEGEWDVRVETPKTQVVQKKSTLHEWEKELIGKQEQLHEAEQKLNEREEHIVSIVSLKKTKKTGKLCMLPSWKKDQLTLKRGLEEAIIELEKVQESLSFERKELENVKVAIEK